MRPWLPLCLVGLVPLFLLLGQPRAWLLGWLHGTATWAVAMFWLVETLTTYGQLEGWLSGLLLLGLAAVLGLYHAAFAALGNRLWRRGGALALAALPALWVVLEVLRGFLITGFPWNLAAYAWTEVPGALRLSAWIGVWGVSLLVAFVSLGIARGIAVRRWQTAAIAVLAAAVVLPVAGRWAGGGTAVDRPASVLRHAAIIQPDTPNQVAFDRDRFEADYARLLALTDRACRPGILVLWPESAAWPMLFGRDERLEADLAAFTARGCSVLFNSASAAGGADERYYNSALLIAPQSPLERYDKRHLVPFGEYVPLAGVFSFISSLARNAGDFRPAAALTLLDLGGRAARHGDLLRGGLSGRGRRADPRRRHRAGHHHQRRLVRRHGGPLAASARRPLPRRGEPPLAAARGDHRGLGGHRAGRLAARRARSRRERRPARAFRRSHGPDAVRSRALGWCRRSAWPSSGWRSRVPGALDILVRLMIASELQQRIGRLSEAARDDPGVSLRRPGSKIS